MIYPIDPRTRSVVASRFRAGDSVELLAEDYGISPEQVEAALREEWRAEPVTIGDAKEAVEMVRRWARKRLNGAKASGGECSAFRTLRACLADAVVYLDDAEKADREGR